MNKVALITGVSKNIGNSICRRFVKEGYKVIGTYKDEFDNEEAKNKFVKECKRYTKIRIQECCGISNEISTRHTKILALIPLFKLEIKVFT